MAEVRGKTAEGFEYSYDSNNADDMELLELVGDLDDGNLTPLPKVFEKLLGKEQKDNLYGFYRALDGRVSIQRMLEVLYGIFNGSNETKNSGPSPATSEDVKTN